MLVGEPGQERAHIDAAIDVIAGSADLVGELRLGASPHGSQLVVRQVLSDSPQPPADLPCALAKPLPGPDQSALE